MDQGPDPDLKIPVKGLVDHHSLSRFGVGGNSHDLIHLIFKVPVKLSRCW